MSFVLNQTCVRQITLIDIGKDVSQETAGEFEVQF